MDNKKDIIPIFFAVDDYYIPFLGVTLQSIIENSIIKSIGITGSNGKTILKEWLYQSLWSEFSTVKSPKSFNSQLSEILFCFFYLISSLYISFQL